jgi:choice-of-anchor A domain-containing protein
LNVLNLSELSLSGNAMLTLSGPVGAQFVINVDDKFSLSGNSQVKVSGGVDPLDVIFNFKGKKATMSGNTMLNGVIMAADGTFEGSGNAIVKGQVVASKIRLDGNAKIVSP